MVFSCLVLVSMCSKTINPLRKKGLRQNYKEAYMSALLPKCMIWLSHSCFTNISLWHKQWTICGQRTYSKHTSTSILFNIHILILKRIFITSKEADNYYASLAASYKSDVKIDIHKICLMGNGIPFTFILYTN